MLALNYSFNLDRYRILPALKPLRGWLGEVPGVSGAPLSEKKQIMVLLYKSNRFNSATSCTSSVNYTL